MGFRTVAISKRCKLSHSLNYLVIRGEEEKRIYLSEINRVIIQSTQVSITTSLLSELSKRKIKVIICDEKYNPEAELVSYYGSHNTSDRIHEQIKWDKNILDKAWAVIVKYKIINQIRVLEKYNHTDSSRLLNTYVADIKEGDLTNREGHAAKVYFNSLFGTGFSRSNLSITNSFLNYGYTILLSLFNREVVSRGYMTQIGIHHKNEFNNFNLSCDLIEPFRPVIDDLSASGLLNEDNFKSTLNNVGNITIVFAGKETFLENAVSLFVGGVLRAIESGNLEEISNFDSYEL